MPSLPKSHCSALREPCENTFIFLRIPRIEHVALVILGPALFSPAMDYRFADCVLDDTAFTLTRDGEVQSIEPQVFDLLHLLMRNPWKLISRDQLIEAVWSGRQVSDSAITARVAAARRVVGDDGKAQSIIRTVPRRGIQFVVDVAGGDPKASYVAMPCRARPCAMRARMTA